MNSIFLRLLLVLVVPFLGFGWVRAPEPEPLPQPHIFVMFRENRAAERVQQLSILENMILNTELSDIQRENAQTAFLELLKRIEFETHAEGLFLARLPFEDVVVVKNSQNINILIRSPGQVSCCDAAQIINIIQDLNPAIPTENIFITVVE